MDDQTCFGFDPVYPQSIPIRGNPTSPEIILLSGRTIIAGNSGADGQRGAAYVFASDDKLNWSQQTKLVAGDGLIEEHFATSVATNGSEVLVSAPGKAITGPSCGAVYYSGITAP